MVNLLGFDIIDTSLEEYLSMLIYKYEKGIRTVVVSGNPEILYTAMYNREVHDLCLNSDIIPDGIGVIISGRMTGQRFKEKIAGIDVLQRLLSYSGSKGAPLYMLGAEEEIVKRAVNASVEKYGACIAGYHNGYFNMEDCGDIIDDINKSGAGILFAAMGCPRQEMFIARYMDKLNCKIFMGVGGSFDVLAGKVKRAPQWMIKSGMEWLYRVANEPVRIFRLGTIPRFIIRAVLYDKGGNKR